MPSLLIRNVDVALHARVKQHAAAHHRSLEEEVRGLLRGAVTRQPQEEHVVDVAPRLFGPKHGVELGITYLRRQLQAALFTSSVERSGNTYGLARMPAGRRRNELAGRITLFLTRHFVAAWWLSARPPRRSTARTARRAKQPAIR